uniref:Uncharacterized protein n=1 Tax=Panagrolaimus davidi TaxID=227884 RepID=A0A914QJ12_9BILA
MNYHQVAELESAWRPLIIVGMLGMTISSTMTNLDQGPIIFQAACKDALFPYLKKFFAKEYGPNKEPRRAYVFFAILTMALCLIGDLNSLNEIVTNLFMVTYALVNYACFDASFARSPGWRPAFPYYNMWISLAAAVICILVMFVISIVHSIIICVIFAITMAYFHYCSPEVNWGDTNQAHMYRNALTSLQKLTNTEIHVKNYRPQIMLLSGNPASRVPLLDFAHSITKGDSLLLAAHVIPYPANEHFFQKQTQLQAFVEQWFKHNKIKGFYLNVANQSIRSGNQNFLQTSGLGKLRPNVLMIGFKNWSKLHRENINEIDEYVGILRDAFESNYGVGILRNGEDGFDHSEELSQLQEKDLSALKRSGEKDGDEFEDAELFGTLMHVRKKSQHHHTPSFRNHHKFYSDRWMFSKPEINSESKSKKSFHFLKHSFTTNSLTAAYSLTGSNRIPSSEPVTPDPTTTTIPNSNINFSFEAGDKTSEVDEERELKLLELQQNLAFELNKFHRNIKKGRIDVWWLYDDGGLTLLIPHLLRLPKSYLEGAQLRIFTLASSQAMIEADEENMIAMLTKFRIEFTNVKVIRDISRKPHRATYVFINKF